MPSGETCLPGRPSLATRVRPSSAAGGGFGERPEATERASKHARNPSPPTSEAEEKDSGFSDGSSEYLSHVEQTDSEEPDTFLPKAMGGLVSSLAPVYLVKNILLQQPLRASPTAQFLAWSSQHPLEKAHGCATRILFVQQPLASLKKPAAKEASLPFPRVTAPLGRTLQAEGRPDQGLTGTGGGCEAKQFCVGEAWVPPGSARVAVDSWEKQQVELLRPPAQPATGAPTRADLAEGRTLSKASRSLGRQRRFHNTVEILRRSGLLGIALRTKELLRQNSSTQRELAELREHAQLLCEAVQSNDAQAWAHLQQAVESSAAPWAGRGLGAQARLGQQNLGGKPTSPAPPAPQEVLPNSAVSVALHLEASLPMVLR